MRFIADLHIHSKFSRATSKAMTLENLSYWAQLKGIRVTGTGDFTHPGWFLDLKEKLRPAQGGLYMLDSENMPKVPPSCKTGVYFIPTAEISCIYSKGGRVRKIHLIVILPALEDVALFNARLSRIGNITADGRPILGLDAKELLRIVLDISGDALLIPAHAWTPHFSVFGASSGFDSIEECFEDLTPHIYAIETGLSSDPPMNWRLSALDEITLISNSDAHSPAKMGREANIFEADLSCRGIMEAIKTGKGLAGTIEFFPEEGKYHFDGHRTCNVRMSPEETRKHDFRCPLCGKPLTVGVMHRVTRLADRDGGFRPPRAQPYYSTVPLQEIISEALKAGVATKKVQKLYQKVITDLGPEFSVLMDTRLDDIERSAGEVVAEGVRRTREGRVNIRPGFDGEYGKVSIFEPLEGTEIKGQVMLF